MDAPGAAVRFHHLLDVPREELERRLHAALARSRAAPTTTHAPGSPPTTCPTSTACCRRRRASRSGAERAVQQPHPAVDAAPPAGQSSPARNGKRCRHHGGTDGEAEIGLIGLGVMGSNLALNIAEKGHRIAVFNRTHGADRRIRRRAPARCSDSIVPCETHRGARRGHPAAAPDHHHGPGRQAGRRADRAAAPRACRRATSSSMPATPISATRCAASTSSRTRPDLHRHGRFRRRGGRAPRPLDHGRRHARILRSASRPVLTAIAAKYQGRALLRLARRRRRRAFRQDHPQRHRICRHADDRRDLRRAARRARHERQGDRRGVRRLEQGPAQLLPDRDHRPRCLPPTIPRPASRWSTSSSTAPARRAPAAGRRSRRRQLGVPATAIEAAVAARVLSSHEGRARWPPRRPMAKRRAAHLPASADALLADLELALFAGKIAAYAQGFAVMDGASKEFGWDLPLPTIAKIWRAGCIIRSQFLGTHRRGLRPGGERRQSADGAGLRRHDEGSASVAAPRRRARRRGRAADAGAVVGARLFRQLPPGPRHRPT